MKKKSIKGKLAIIFSVLIVFLLAFIAGLIYARKERVPRAMIMDPSWSQNALDYLDQKTKNKPLLPERQQAKAADYSLKQFFSPWGAYLDKKIQSVYQYEKNELSNLHATKQYGINFHPYGSSFWGPIIRNMNLESFPNMNKKAIIIKNVSTREILTVLPAFTQPAKNITYPFDNFAHPPLWVGQPVRVLNKSRDGAWYLINFNYVSSWVKKGSFVVMDQPSIDSYQKNKFVAITKDSVPVKDSNEEFLFYSRIGELLPYRHGRVYALTQGYKLQPLKIAASAYTNYPLKITPDNMASIMNALMGEPYTWGLNGYRECSLTTKNLFMTFGIWLPKHSQNQLTYLPYIDVSHLSDTQKYKLIREKAKPFLTLLGTPGHVTLYIGQHEGHEMVFQDRWSYHTKDIFGDEGRLIIGKTIIDSLIPSNQNKNPAIKSYLLTDLSKMTFLGGYPNSILRKAH